RLLKSMHGSIRGDLFWVRGIHEKRRVVSGPRLIAGLVVVISHNINLIDIARDCTHLRVIKPLLISTRGDAEIEPPVQLFLLLIKALPQLPQNGGVVLLVFGTKSIPCAALPGVFPVDVQSIQVVSLNEGDDGVNEDFPARFCEHRVGEVAGPQPSADRDEYGQRRVLLPLCVEGCKIRGVSRIALDDAAVFDIRESIVDPGELLDSDFPGLQQMVLRKDIADYNWRPRTPLRRKERETACQNCNHHTEKQ